MLFSNRFGFIYTDKITVRNAKMKRKEWVISNLKAHLDVLDYCIKNFDKVSDFEIAKRINEVKGFFSGFRFCMEYHDIELIRTKEELTKSDILDSTYPEFSELWDKIEEKLEELEKMFLLTDEFEAGFLADEELEKRRR